MTIDDEADIVTAPMSPESTGVIGTKVDSSRTDAMLPVVLLAHEDPVHEPVGAAPLGSQRTYNCDVVTDANGEIIRLVAVSTSAFSAVAFAGQTGPPAVPQLGCPWASQLASTEASRAPSRAACERTVWR